MFADCAIHFHPFPSDPLMQKKLKTLPFDYALLHKFHFELFKKNMKSECLSCLYFKTIVDEVICISVNEFITVIRFNVSLLFYFYRLPVYCSRGIYVRSRSNS